MTPWICHSSFMQSQLFLKTRCEEIGDSSSLPHCRELLTASGWATGGIWWYLVVTMVTVDTCSNMFKHVHSCSNSWFLSLVYYRQSMSESRLPEWISLQHSAHYCVLTSDPSDRFGLALCMTWDDLRHHILSPSISLGQSTAQFCHSRPRAWVPHTVRFQQEITYRIIQ